MRRHVWVFVMLAVASLVFAPAAFAVHPDCALGQPGIGTLDEQIECAIQKGLAWATSQQSANGSWNDGYSSVAATGLYCVKYIDRAQDLGVDPFDEAAYEYADDLLQAVGHLAAQLVPGDPGELKVLGSYTTYATGIAAMCFASAAGANPEGTATVGGTVRSYGEITNGLAAWLTGNQQVGGCATGGWYYNEKENYPSWADNSISGYATMGLGFAQSLTDYTIPADALNRLDSFVDNVQRDGGAYDGGSIYGAVWSGTPPNQCSSTFGATWINILKTGNLLYELCLLEDPETSSRVARARAFLEQFWTQAPGDRDGGGWIGDYQAMFTMMKGLEGCGIESLNLPGEEGTDWFARVAAWIVENQRTDGSFYDGNSRGTPVLDTAWALLTLEKAVPRLEFGIPDQCVAHGTLFESFDADDYVVLGEPPYAWTFAGSSSLTVTKTDDNVFTVTYPAGWVGSETITFTATDANGKTSADTATFTVSAVPDVGDIPDQTSPFTPFDLDTFLQAPVPSAVTWTFAGNTCLQVSIDAANVVTVTNPGTCQDPETITFTATGSACEAPVSDSDAAVFTPNQPPDCSAAAPSVGTLWPPNHQFVSVSVLGVTDPDGDPVTITVDAIRQDEPVDTQGDGSFTPDGRGVGTSTAELRAERTGTRAVPGDGRVYHVAFSAADGRGGSCSGRVLVGVPHDQGQRSVPVDGGPLFDSTVVAP